MVRWRGQGKGGGEWKERGGGNVEVGIRSREGRRGMK